MITSAGKDAATSAGGQSKVSFQLRHVISSFVGYSTLDCIYNTKYLFSSDTIISATLALFCICLKYEVSSFVVLISSKVPGWSLLAQYLFSSSNRAWMRKAES